VLHVLTAKHFCQLTGGVAASHVHLPQAILCRHVALGKKQIFKRCGRDIRDTLGIAGHCDRGLQAREGETPVNLRKSGVRSGIKAGCHDHYKSNKAQGNYAQNSKCEATSAAGGNGNRSHHFNVSILWQTDLV
jgi:hypothetical protein